MIVLNDKKYLLDIAEKEKKAITSLVDFRKYFLPDKDDVESASFHHRWSNILLRGEYNYAFEGFRESAKTQLVIRANAFHALTYPMPKRSYIAFMCKNATIASARLNNITNEWKYNTRMNHMMDKIIEDNSRAFEVTYKEGAMTPAVRIEAYGKGSAIRGAVWGSKRPDLVIMDDLQDLEDLLSDASMHSDWLWFISDIKFIGQSSRLFLIGNNLGEKSIIERVLVDPEALDFIGEKIPAIDEDGESTWPQKYPIEFLTKERDNFARLGEADTWYRERMCKLIAPDSQKFKRSYFRYYDSIKLLKLDEMNIYLTVDIAVSQSKSADYFAIICVAVNEEGHWFILDIDRNRYDPSESINAIFNMVKKYHPLSVGIEAVAYQAALEHFIIKEMPKRNVFFNITPLKAKGSKHLRIDTLQPRLAAGTVWFPREAHWLNVFEDELLSYPNGKHDDMIDALAYLDQIASVPVATGSKGLDASMLSEKLREKRKRFSVYDMIRDKR